MEKSVYGEIFAYDLSVQHLCVPTVAFLAFQWPTRPLTWPETIVNMVNWQLGKSRFCSSFILASATRPKAILMNQGPKDEDCSPLVHLLFRFKRN